MTNKEAVDMIASMGKYLSSGNPIWETESVKEATDMAIKALETSAWIPVGERLPEPYQHVLVSLDSRYDGDATYDWITETLDDKLKWYDWDRLCYRVDAVAGTVQRGRERMICPWLKSTTSYKSSVRDETYEEYCGCYGDECPWYREDSGDCMRTYTEYHKAKKGGDSHDD